MEMLKVLLVERFNGKEILQLKIVNLKTTITVQS